MVLVLVMLFNTGITTGVSLSSAATTPIQIGSTLTAQGGGIFTWSGVWYIVAGASDPGATLTYSPLGSSGGTLWFNVGLVSYTGVATAAIPDCQSGASFFSAASTGTTTTPAATTNTAGVWQVQLLAVGPPGNDFIVPGSMTSRQSIVHSQNAGLLLAIADSNGGVGGIGTSIGNTTWTNPGAAGNTWSTSFTVGLSSPSAPAYSMQSM